MDDEPLGTNMEVSDALRSLAGGMFSDKFLEGVQGSEAERGTPLNRCIKYGVLQSARQIAADMGFMEEFVPSFVNAEDRDSGIRVTFGTARGPLSVEITADGLRILITSSIPTDMRGQKTVKTFLDALVREGVYLVPEIAGVDSDFRFDYDFDNDNPPFVPNPPAGGSSGFRTKVGYINGPLIDYDNFFARFRTPQGILEVPIGCIENFEPDLISGKIAQDVRMSSASSDEVPRIGSV